MSMYLMIENAGEAPIEAYTRLGDSGTRQRSGRFIGQFGSGNKLGLTMLCRKGISATFHCGTTKGEFYAERDHITEADGKVRESYPMKCQLSGKSNRKIDLGWDLLMGAMDWDDVGMALREFISNAIDCSKVMGTEPVIKMEPKPRGKSGTTRVFIEATPAVMEYFQNLSVHFLHFSSDPSQVDKRFLKKNPETKGPRVYREGALVRTLSADVPAAFDYNFKAGEIKIDEARNLSEYALRAKIAQAINIADSETLATLFERLAEGEVYEATLDKFYLSYEESEREQINWRAAWEKFAGDAVIASEAMAASPIGEHAKRKGHKVVAIKSDSISSVIEKMGVPTVASVIGEAAAAGRIDCEATRDAIEAVETVWAWLETVEMTKNKPCPKVACYKQLMDGESECLGFYRPGTDTVHIREDLAGKIALKTALEEVAHYVTGSTDLSRDFQNFAFDMIVELCV